MTSNVSDNSYLRVLEGQNTAVWPAIFYCGVILPFSVVGNLTVVVVVHSHFKPSATRTFIMAVSFYSLGLAAAALPVQLYSLLHVYTFPYSFLCKCYNFVEIFCTVGSAAILLVVAVHRYLKICRPFHGQMTLRKAHFLSLVVAVVSLAVALPAFVFYGLQPVKIRGSRLEGRTCGLKDEYRKSFYVVVSHYVFLSLFIGGALTIVVLYVLIAKKIIFLMRCKCNRAIANGAYNQLLREMMLTVKKKSSTSESKEPWAPKRTSQRSSVRSKRRRSMTQTKRTTSMLAVTTLVIFVSFLPTLIIRTTDQFRLDLVHLLSPAKQMTYHVFLRSYYVHCAATPVIYGAFNAKFRHELRALVSPRIRKT